ncbi:MAG: hypothetical protein ABW190_14620 [Rhizobacter sp.]
MQFDGADDRQASRCHYAWGSRHVIKTFQGFVTGLDFIRSAEVVSADPRFDDLSCVYNDFVAIDGHCIDAATYQRVAACRMGAMYTNPNYRVMFIATEPFLTELRHAIAGADATLPFHPALFSSLVASQMWVAQQPVLTSRRR